VEALIEKRRRIEEEGEDAVVVKTPSKRDAEDGEDAEVCVCQPPGRRSARADARRADGRTVTMAKRPRRSASMRTTRTRTMRMAVSQTPATKRKRRPAPPPRPRPTG
jgi:hypothetical protein